MKKIIFIAVILAGIIFQSCEKIENPPVDYLHVTLRKGFHGNNTYRMDAGTIQYTSDEAIEIFFIVNEKETFMPEYSMGKEVGNNIGDTIRISIKNNKLIRINGRIQVL
jgi:hypothetical protein